MRESPQFEKKGEKSEESVSSEIFDVAGGIALLGVAAYGIKKFWEAKGPEIKQKVGDAASRIIGSCIEKGESEIKRTLGLEKTGAQSEGRPISEDKFYERCAQDIRGASKDAREKFGKAVSPQEPEIVDAEFTMVGNEKEPISDERDFDALKDFGSMDRTEVLEAVKKVSSDPSYAEVRQDFFAIFMHEATLICGEKGILGMSEEEEYRASREALRKFYAFGMHKRGRDPNRSSRDKAFDNMTVLASQLFK
jgi:hypothetical protein